MSIHRQRKPSKPLVKKKSTGHFWQMAPLPPKCAIPRHLPHEPHVPPPPTRTPTASTPHCMYTCRHADVPVAWMGTAICVAGNSMLRRSRVSQSTRRRLSYTRPSGRLQAISCSTATYRRYRRYRRGHTRMSLWVALLRWPALCMGHRDYVEVGSHAFSFLAGNIILMASP